MISSFSFITPNYQNLILYITIRFIFGIINIIDAASVSVKKLLKIVLTADLYIFLIASNIRYVEIRTLIPLLLLQMAGVLNISRILKFFVLSCIDCWRLEIGNLGYITIVVVVRLRIIVVCPRTLSWTVFLKLTLSYITTTCRWCFRVWRCIWRRS